MSWSRKIAVVCGVLIIGIGAILTDTLVSAGYFRTINPHFSGTCTRVDGVVGAEDITINPATGVAYISAFDRRTFADAGAYHGGIYRYAPGSFKRPEKMALDNAAFFHPHGIDLWVPETGNVRLFAVTHPPAVPGTNDSRAAQSIVKIFDVTGNSLVPVGSAAPDAPVSLNDVTATGPDSFYASIDKGSHTSLGRTFEQFGRLARAGILYGKGGDTRKALGGLVYANGLQASADGSTLYVAETTGKRLSSYAIDQDTGDLTLIAEQDINSALDNIEMDADGNLWIGAHPKSLDFLAHAGDKNRYSPSQVFKINVRDATFDVEEIYLNDGTPISGSSVAAPTKDGFLIGSVFEPFILDCSMP